ncbi:DUF1376 domain-containing protein [Mesorhizobium sp. A556]
MSAVARQGRPAAETAAPVNMDHQGKTGTYSQHQGKTSQTALWFFRFFPSEWTTKTRGWKPAEKGIWIDLLVMMQQRGEPLPEDHRRLARSCGTTEALFKKVLGMLVEERIIVRQSAGLWNGEVQDEVDHRKEKSKKASENSSERWGKNKQKQKITDADAYRDKSIEIDGALSERPFGPRSTIKGSTIVGDDAPLAGASQPKLQYRVGKTIYHEDHVYTVEEILQEGARLSARDVDTDVSELFKILPTGEIELDECPY